MGGFILRSQDCCDFGGLGQELRLVQYNLHCILKVVFAQTTFEILAKVN